MLIVTDSMGLKSTVTRRLIQIDIKKEDCVMLRGRANMWDPGSSEAKVKPEGLQGFLWRAIRPPEAPCILTSQLRAPMR